MGKKSSKLSIVYLIGMALVAIGFCCPLFKGLGTTPNGFKFLDFDNFGFVTIGGLLIFIGAVAGIIFTFVPSKSSDLIKLICVIVSIVGGVILVIGFNDSWISKMVGKGFFKHAYFGFYMVLVGWVVGLVGAIMKK